MSCDLYHVNYYLLIGSVCHVTVGARKSTRRGSNSKNSLLIIVHRENTRNLGAGLHKHLDINNNQQSTELKEDDKTADEGKTGEGS